MVDHFLPRIGGIELQVRDLALQLAERGAVPHIITSTPGNIDLAGIKIHRLPVKLMPGFKIMMQFRAYKYLEEILRREKIDLVHAHGSVVSPLAYGSLKVSHRLHIPAVFTGHSLWEYSTPTFRLLYLLNRGDHWNLTLTAVSQEVAKGLKKTSPAREIHFLPNAIQPKAWEIQKTPHEGINFVSVLRLNKKKRVHALLRMIPKILAKAPPDQRIQFHLIGKGPYENRLHQICRSLKIEEHVRFHGYLDRKEILPVFSSADIFIHPTKKEALGIALLEARAAGLPCIALDYGGTKDILTHEKTGLLAGNDGEMVDHALRLIRDPALRKRLGLQAKADIESFSWDHVLDRLFEIYQKGLVLERKAS